MPVSLEGMSAEAIADLAGLAKGLSENPKTRTKFLHMMKEADPSLSIPEIDTMVRLNAAVKPHLEKIDKLSNQIAERDIRDTIKERRAALAKDKGLSDADIKDVEKLMIDKGIQNHDTAAEFFIAQRNSAPPTPTTFSQPAIPRPDMKEMGGNISQWARNQATTALSEIIKNRPRAA